MIDIDYHKTINAFKQLGIVHFDKMYSQTTASDLFENLETGKISNNHFYEAIREEAKINLTNEQIETAWNAILLDFRPNSIAYLKSLANKHSLYLLSNTNSIHQQSFLQTFKNTFGKNLNDFFIKAYYSHEIHLRKPYESIYNFVLKDAKINASETLFIDDSKINIPAAKEVGIKTHLLLPTETIEQIISKYID